MQAKFREWDAVRGVDLHTDKLKRILVQTIHDLLFPDLLKPHMYPTGDDFLLRHGFPSCKLTTQYRMHLNIAANSDFFILFYIRTKNNAAT